jgi:hypothetical protein
MTSQEEIKEIVRDLEITQKLIASLINRLKGLV